MSERMAEFFILEASDYLDRLDALCASAEPSSPDADGLQRVTRALRGVARLHEFQAIAAVAGALERAAAGLRDGTVSWDQALGERLARTVADLRVLVPGVRAWDEVMATRAREAQQRWAGVGGGARPEAAPSADDREVAAFVATQLRGIAEAVSAAVLRPAASVPAVPDGLRGVLRVLAPLAGAAWLDRFPAVSELVHTLDDVTRLALSRDQAVEGPWREFYGQVVRAAVEAAGRIAAGAALTGAEWPEALRHLVGLLTGEAAGEEEVVPIESLFYDDEGPHVISFGAAAEQREEVPVEVRNFFLIEATSLIDRAQALFGEVAAGRAAAAQDLRTALDELARTFGWFQFMETGRVVRGMAQRAEALALDPALARPFELAFGELRAIVERIDRPAEAAERSGRIAAVLGVEAARPPATEPAVAASAAAMTAGVGTPEGALAATRAAAAEEDVRGFESADGIAVSAAGAAGVAIPAAAPAAEPAAAHAAAPGPVIAITELLYSGRGALERALELKPELRAALLRGDLAALEMVLSELFDLIDLAGS